jgi:hypothetical protein
MKTKFNPWLSNQCGIVNMNILLPNGIDIKCPSSIYDMLMWYMKDDKTTFIPNTTPILPKGYLSP